MVLNKYLITHDTKVLHLAPEKGLYKALSDITSKSNYDTADFSPDMYKSFAEQTRKIDLCDLDAEPSDYFDFIIHSHVLEHTPCNIAYSLYHLHRMLKPSGKHICIIPFVGGGYDESFQKITSEESKRRFGQSDHVRRFGVEDVGLHVGILLNIPQEFDATKSFSEDFLRQANIPESHWYGLTIGTVLELSKKDYKL
jgi:phosphoglycolate phosphatase